MGLPFIGKRDGRWALLKWIRGSGGRIVRGRAGKCRIRRIVLRFRWGRSICSSESSKVWIHSDAGIRATFTITDRNRMDTSRSVDIHIYPTGTKVPSCAFCGPRFLSRSQPTASKQLSIATFGCPHHKIHLKGEKCSNGDCIERTVEPVTRRETVCGFLLRRTI